jgi:hypothetical protein
VAKELQSISLGAAGFLGINTMDPPLQQSLDFADTANNAVIDTSGRLASRKGFDAQSDVITALAGYPIDHIAEWSSPDGNSYLYAAGNNKIFRIDTTTLANDTLTLMAFPGGYSVSDDEWQTVDFNGELHWFQLGHVPLIINETSNGSNALVTNDAESADSVPAAPIAWAAIAAYGRLWAGGVAANKSKVYWTDTLIGDSWTEGASGSIDLTLVWPNGYDELVGIGAHNERIIFFGKNSIVVYSGATNPATMVLEDTIAGSGCSFRDSIVHTGDDILYCAPTGIKSLGRTVLQTSLPTTDLTKNIRKTIQQTISGETQSVSAEYSLEESMYVITFKGVGTTYYIDMRTTIDEEGARKCTVWPGSPFNCWKRSDSGSLFCGGLSGFGRYFNYSDDGVSYRFQYYGPALDFGDSSKVKVVKKMIATVTGGSGREATFYWGYGYSGAYKSQVITLDSLGVAEYGIDEYNVAAEYSTGIGVTDNSVNTTGSGAVVKVGFGVSINGSEFVLNQLRVHVIIGKII